MKKTLRTYALANELKLEGSGPQERIVIPYGTWPYGMKTLKTPDGTERKVFVTQRLDASGAASIVAGLRLAMANGAPGIPIYWGHPDVPEVAGNFPDKRAKAWVKKAEATEAGLALANIEWLEDPGGGFGWYSPYWVGQGKLTDAHNAVTEISALVSIGLTNSPNILEFRLANEADYNPETTTTSGTAAQPKDTEMPREQILQVLGLPPETTDEQIIAAVTKLKTDAANSATQVEAANAEAAAAKDEKEELKTALANERQARADILLDQAIAERKIGVAARPAWAKRLAEDPKAGALALANEKTLKTESATSGLKPGGSAATSPIALANEKVRQGLTFDAAWAAVKTERPDLFQ